MIVIKSNEISANNIRGIINELVHNYSNELRLISNNYGWSQSDTAEAVASYIYYNDMDYVVNLDMYVY